MKAPLLTTDSCVTDFWFNTLHREVLRAPKARNNDGPKKISINRRSQWRHAITPSLTRVI
ncbi:hypothetical protein ACB376_26210 [Klebsiella electrica]